MLRRTLLALMVWVLAAGFVAPAEAAFAPMECGHLSSLAEASAVHCGDGAMAIGSCASACHAGACIVADASPGVAEPGFSTGDLPVHRFARSGATPEIAPPKPTFV